MESYCAFLRGINVNGKKMKMEEACEVLTNNKFSEVSSILATGNLIFKTDQNKGDLREVLENILSLHFNTGINLFIKSKEEINKIIENVPFKEDGDFHIYVFICEDGFEKILMEEFNKIEPSNGERAKINGEIFFWRCEKGETLDSGFSKILGRASMKSKFTSRNISTIKKILNKMS